MNAISSTSRTWSPDEPLVASNIVAVFAAARRQRAASNSGASGKALRGRNLALLLSTPSGPGMSPLHRAARDLGARVAEVRFETDASLPPDIGSLARLLGRMYDAIDCGALPDATRRRIELEAGVPVYAGLGLDDHPARMLADLMTLCEHATPATSQAVLMFLGDLQTVRSRIFVSAARQMGFALHVGEFARPASDAAYMVDATEPSHWSLHGPAGPIDDVTRSENHRCMMQTVLLDTMRPA